MAKMGIYCILNKTNGKRYIGQSIDLNRRIKDHTCYFKSNKSRILSLQADYNNGDEIQFLILKEVEHKKDLLRLEAYYCGLFNSFEEGYNGNIPTHIKAEDNEITIFINSDINIKKIEKISKELEITADEFCKNAVMEKIFFYDKEANK